MSDPVQMKGLPYVPLDPQWLMESPAFASSKPQLVRAVTRMFVYAWSATPAGTLPTNYCSLASILGLTESEVVENHEELFSGWVLADGRLQFEPMSSLCERISARHGEALSALADRAAALIQSPDDFELLPTDAAASSSRKGKHRIPKDWALTGDLCAWLIEKGFAAEDHGFIAEKFVSHYESKGEMLLKWDAAFRNFALKENRAYLPSARRLQSPPLNGTFSRASRFGAAGGQARAHNEGALLSAAQRMRGGPQ